MFIGAGDITEHELLFAHPVESAGGLRRAFIEGHIDIEQARSFREGFSAACGKMLQAGKVTAQCLFEFLAPAGFAGAAQVEQIDPDIPLQECDVLFLP